MADIRFSFTPYSDADGTTQAGQMIREIDVFGTPTAVSEPATWALMGLGGLVLVWRLRRERHAA